ncbi:hypothetical protein LCGC14_1504090, partial [marine sediment metagenome]
LNVLNGLPPDQRQIITEDMTPVGMYPLSAEEKMAVAKAMHESPELRKIVGDIAYYHEDDKADLLKEAVSQTDLSIMPPIVKGTVLEDDYEDDQEAKLLKEDMEALKSGEDLKEVEGEPAQAGK